MESWPVKPSQTEPRILQWAEQFPRLVRLRTRRTFSGRTAYAVTVGDPGAKAGKRRLLVAQPHAHEPAATAGMMGFLCRLLTGRNLDGGSAELDRQAILGRCEVTFVPDGNPDGRARAPEDAWDGTKYTNRQFLDIAFGRTAGGERFPRLGRWNAAEHRPAEIGIVYERISETEYVEPNRDPASTYCRLVGRVLDEDGCDGLLSLHQTEFERSEHNAMVLLPFLHAELPADLRGRNERWAAAVIEAWRGAGGNPRPDPRPLGYGEDQLRYFRACWSDVYRRVPAITVEVQNNHVRTPPAMQRRLQEAAIQATLEHVLAAPA
jgi:murein tripeptide amidase MpaA